MIKVNEAVPNIGIKFIQKNDVTELNFNDYAIDKNLVVFGVPGAFTPTCSNLHLPNFANQVEDFKKKGVDAVICLSVNDAFVLRAWAIHHKVEDKLSFIADGNADLTQAMGLTLDGTPFGMGIRSQRYSMYVEKGIVRILHLESTAGACTISSASVILDQL